MPDPIALIPTRLSTTPFGLASRVAHTLAGRSVLAHTVARVARVGLIKKIVLVHEAGDDPVSLLGGRAFGVPVFGFVVTGGLTYPHQHKHAAARKWSLEAWRGGLGGATCYDELWPAAPLFEAMKHHGSESALLVGADWPLVDPEYCRRVLELHLTYPQNMQMTFTQAPPGLAGVAIGRNLIDQIAQNDVSLGQLIGYNPLKPQADPIGRDLCVQIPASVRSCACRLVYDTPATAAMIDRLFEQMGDGLSSADAQVVTAGVSALGERTDEGFATLPQMVTLELTPRRSVNGPIVPQHHIRLDRPDMAIDAALKIVGQLGADQDTVLTLGGLGDALLHPRWEKVVAAAQRAGVLGMAVETDLLVDQEVLERLLDLPIDIITVRLNADTAATYKKVMDPADTLGDGFAKTIANLEWLINHRRGQTPPSATDANGLQNAGLPWLVMRLAKTIDTLGDMETFFDRWVHYAGHAVIEPATTGCGLIADASPVRMDPPGRFACRQVTRRMTIHCDGQVAQCDQDWLGRACGGDAVVTPLADIWRLMQPLRQAHAGGRWDELPLCRDCHEWHRP